MGDTGARLRVQAAADAFVATWRNRDLRRVQLGFAGASAGEWAFTVGIGVYAYRHGGATAVGIVSMLRMLPAAVVAPVLTPVADHWRRERVLVVVSAVRGASAAVAAGVVAAGGATALVYALAIVSATAAVLYRPVHSALLPSLCRTAHELAGCNVVRGTLDSAAILVGPAAAAALVGPAGVAGVFLAVAALTTGSGVLVLAVRPEVPAVRRVPSRLTSAWLLTGLAVVWRQRDLRLLVGLSGVQTVLRGAVNVFTVVVAIDLLGIGASGVGELVAAIGAGAVVGSFAASMLIGTQRLARWFGVGVAMWGLPLVVLAAHPMLALTLVLLAGLGIGNALVDVGLFTLMARLAPDQVLARVFGALECVVALGVALGAVLAPVAISQLGVRGALVLLGLLSPACVAGQWWRLRKLDQAMEVRDHEVDLLRTVPMLAPLTLPAIEQLAAGLEPLTVPAGAPVFLQGDVGDRFFVIEDGVAEVVGDGRTVTSLGRGDGFGEVALLRQVPRTATVRARTDLRLESLTGERFTAVVTGFRPSADEADAHVQEMLRRFVPRQRADIEPVTDRPSA